MDRLIDELIKGNAPSSGTWAHGKCRKLSLPPHKCDFATINSQFLIFSAPSSAPTQESQASPLVSPARKKVCRSTLSSLSHDMENLSPYKGQGATRRPLDFGVGDLNNNEGAVNETPNKGATQLKFKRLANLLVGPLPNIYMVLFI